jgi:hypothetical protein
MRRTVLAIALLLTAPSAPTWGVEAETLQILGQAGVLGEWELTANLTATSAVKQFSGALLMKHVGFCSVDGPEEKRGEIQLQLVSPSRVKATLSIDGASCTYDGRKTDGYNGVMRCPDRREVPLVLWLK